MNDERVTGPLSTSEAGRTITSSMRNWAEPLAEVFTHLLRAVEESGRQKTLVEHYRLTFGPVVPVADSAPQSSALELRLAISALLCQWLAASLNNHSDGGLSLDEADSWFLADATNAVPGLVQSRDWIPNSCYKTLNRISFGPELADLLPYILQVFELIGTDGDQLDRDHRRSHQRTTGIIYTPSDVSDFISRETLAHWKKLNMPKETLRCLDPACGTGLFLRSALSLLSKSISEVGTSPLELVQSLYGMDVSHQAIQSSTFVLLTHCLSMPHGLPISPWRTWHLIRGNLAAIDSTIVGRVETHALNNEVLLNLRLRSKRVLLETAAAPWTEYTTSSAPGANPLGEEMPGTSTSIGRIFPEATDGFSVVFGNPPYSHIRKDHYQAVRAANFRTAPALPGQSATLYPMFVEMMWRFGSTPSCSGGMVLPMSIAYSTSSQVRRLRAAIQEMPGDWRFSFFDRTPDSLFGDEVKTRNAIVLWHRSQSTKEPHFFTGPLVRWNSRNRKNLFRNVCYMDLGKYSISKLIPKLGSVQERDTYYGLRNQQACLKPLIEQVPASRAKPGTEYPCAIFYSSTGYNWIPVFRAVPVSRDAKGEESPSPSVHMVTCSTESDADFVFASLNSRLTYWLWRVEGDGFHVTYDFIRGLPFQPSRLSIDELRDIRGLAARLWSEMRQNPVTSTNAGRTTVSYYPYACQDTLDAIDKILGRSLGISSDFVLSLGKFVMENILAGREREIGTNPALRRLMKAEETDDKVT